MDADDGFAGRTLSQSITQCPDKVSDALSRVVAGFGRYGEGGYIIAAYGRNEKKDEVVSIYMYEAKNHSRTYMYELYMCLQIIRTAFMLSTVVYCCLDVCS